MRDYILILNNHGVLIGRIENRKGKSTDEIIRNDYIGKEIFIVRVEKEVFQFYEGMERRVVSVKLQQKAGIVNINMIGGVG